MTHPYATPAYAAACARVEDCTPLAMAGGWIGVRRIAGSSSHDAAGPYPFFPAAHELDLAALRSSLQRHALVSLVLVTDALDGPPIPTCPSFDVIRAYKQHHVVDRGQQLNISTHHRREIRRALNHCQTSIIKLDDHLESWAALYQNLVSRHRLTGLHLFSEAYFRALCAVPGLTTIAAFKEGRMVSCHLWFKHRHRAYSHLAASSEEGYAAGAAYAVYAHAIDLFADCELIDLGGVPDLGARRSGLDAFKQGFANAVRTSHLCGVIGQATTYEGLCAEAGHTGGHPSYFPAYRVPG